MKGVLGSATKEGAVETWSARHCQLGPIAQWTKRLRRIFLSVAGQALRLPLAGRHDKHSIADSSRWGKPTNDSPTVSHRREVDTKLTSPV
jgi:hypothetical protein